MQTLQRDGEEGTALWLDKPAFDILVVSSPIYSVLSRTLRLVCFNMTRLSNYIYSDMHILEDGCCYFLPVFINGHHEDPFAPDRSIRSPESIESCALSPERNGKQSRSHHESLLHVRN